MIGSKTWQLIEKMIYIFLKAIFSLVKRDLTEETVNSFLQFVKFGIVGLSNNILYYIIYTISLLLFRKFNLIINIDYVVAQVIAFLLSVLWSFYWNNKVVFKLEDGKSRNIWGALLKTYISYSFTGLFLNSILIVLWVQVLNISEFIAPIFNLIISVPVNFIINKFWAFKQK